MAECASFKTAKVLSCIASLIAIVGILLLLIVVFERENRPQWVEVNNHELQNLFTISTEIEADIFDLDKSRHALRVKAVSEVRKAAGTMAMKQIKISYGWETLDQDTKTVTADALADILKHTEFKQLTEQSLYTDFIKLKRHGLYSMDSSEMYFVLQGIYEAVNKVLLEQMQEEEIEEIENIETIEDENQGGYEYEDGMAS